MTRRLWRGPLVLLVVLGAFLGPGVAMAATSASRTSGTVSLSTPTWAAGVAPYGSSTFASTSVNSSLDKDYFFTFKNIGTATLGTRFSVAIPMASTNGAYADLEYCDAGWNVAADTCAGTVTVVAVTGATYSFTLPPSFPSGATLTLRVHPSVPDAVNTATFSVRLSNIAGAGVTTNS